MTKKNHKNVGLIIKGRSISAIEVQVKNNIPAITNYSKILLEEGIIENDCIMFNKESFKEAVKKLLAKGIGGPFNIKNLFISLPEEKAFVHQITVPKEKANDDEYIKKAANDYIPIELNQAVFDFKTVYDNPGEKTVTVNVVAMQSSIVQAIIDALKEIKLEVTLINIDIYCIIKSFHNFLNRCDGSHLLINMEPARDLIAIVSEDDRVKKIVSKEERSNITDKLKSLLGVANNEELKKVLTDIRHGANLTEEQKTSIKNSFEHYFEDLSNKIREIMEIVGEEGISEIKGIYLTGVLSALPGTEEILGNLLPDIPIKKNIEYTEIPLEIEEDGLEGIGLCTNEVLPDKKNDYNILPEIRKNEIGFRQVYPKIKLLNITLAVLLILLTVKVGIGTASSYLNYRLSSREVAILNEQALNPYITQTVQEKQAEKNNYNQVLLLTNDSVPVSSVIRDLDSYNKNGVSLSGFNYKDTISSEKAEVDLRAVINNRETTEKFINSLKTGGHYSEVISPLSNLVGKGERFVTVGLTVDKAKTIESFETPKAPAITKENNDEKAPE